MNPQITHIPKSFGVRFFNDDYNNHQIKIGSITGNLILPGGDDIMHPDSVGVVEYNCVIHPWIDGKLHVGDEFLTKHDGKIITNDIQLGNILSDGTILQDNTSQIKYDVTNCGICYVGFVTKVIDGDTIHVDGTSVRLALVNTPEKRQTGYDDATNFVKTSCGIGSSVLVDVDDVLPLDELGVNFAKITCSDVTINESLMDAGLGTMYDSFCTESEFMYELWATHDCKKPQTTPSDIVPKITPEIIITPLNNTVFANNTIQIPSEIVPKQDIQIVYIVVFLILITCLVILYAKKVSPTTKISYHNFLWVK